MNSNNSISRSSSRGLLFRTLGELRNDTSEPPPAIIDDGILLERTLLLLYGKPKSKKTFLALNLAIAIATGRSFGGFQIVKPSRIMVVSAEGGYFPTRKRIQNMIRHMETEHDDNLTIATGARISLQDETIKSLESQIEEFKPDVVVLDPLIKFHSADENSSKEMGQVMNAIRGLIETYGISIILVHHTGKNAENGPRGSSAIVGEYDSAIEISEVGNDGSKYGLEFDMRHVETPLKRNLFFNAKTNWFECIDENPIVKVLRERNEPTETSSLVKTLANQGMSKSTAYNRVNKCIAAGAIERLKDGRLVFKN